MILEELSRPVVAGPAVFLLLCLLYAALTNTLNVPKGLPWVGWKPGVLAHFRASLQGVLHNHEMFEEGYRKVCQIKAPSRPCQC